METITFTCKVITPMFLAGADGQTPELRAPSIKGAMRFWWRAMHGHLVERDENGNWDYSKLKKREEEIFGGTSREALRSKVVVRVNQLKLYEGKLDKQLNQDINPGIFYLFYSIPMNNRSGFWSGEFNITLSSFDTIALQESILSLWLLSNFGGIGSRARRGAGSFKIIDISSTIQVDFFELTKNKNEPLKDYLKRNLDLLALKFDYKRNFNPEDAFIFPVLFNVEILLLSDYYPSFLSSLENIGQKYKFFRDKYQPDYTEVKNFIVDGVSPKQIQRVEFGLPLSFRYSSLNSRPRVDIKTTDKSIDRSASSLLFHISEFEGKYYTILVNFASKLLPDNIQLELFTARDNIEQYKKRPKKIINNYHGIKETFLQELNAEII